MHGDPPRRPDFVERILFEHPRLYRLKRFLIERVLWGWILSGVFRLSRNPLPDITDVVSGKRVLLAASGPGDVSTGPSIDAAAHVVAFDISRAFAAACRRNRPDWLVYCGDVARIPFRDQTFDVAVIYSSLHHIPAGAERIFGELARVTVGRIIVLEGVVPQRGLMRHALLAWYAIVDRGVHYYTRVELEAVFARLGLTIERISAHGPIRHMLLAILRTAPPRQMGL